MGSRNLKGLVFKGSRAFHINLLRLLGVRMAKVARVLTEKEIKKLSTIAGTHAVGGVSGLSLRVRAGKTGLMLPSWVLRVRGNGKEQVYTLGTYPDLSTKDARARGQEYRVAVTSGVPIDTKGTKARVITFGEAFNEFSEFYRLEGGHKRPEYAERALRNVSKHLELIWDKDIKTLEPRDIAEAIKDIWYTHSSTFDKLKQTLSHFFTWCTLNKKYRDSPENIAIGKYMRVFLGNDESKRKPKDNHPYLPPERVPELFKAVFSLDTLAAYALLFTVLCVLRNGNARSITWDQISEIEYQGVLYPVIVFDKEAMKVSKNGQHLVPLTREQSLILAVVRKFQRFNNSHVFPGDSQKEGQIGELSEGTLGKVIKQSHSKEIKEGREGWLDPERNRVAVPHGLARASFKTWAIREKIDKRIIDLAEHHAVSDYNGAYDRDITLKDKA